ncbi:MAG: response regulator [Tunicatimonas sp.]
MKKTVLIVDDEQEICFLLAMLLKQLGYEADYAHSVHDGLNKLSANSNLDLVFLDLNLPDGLGYTMIPEIKRQNQATKVVMISAHDSTLRRIKGEVSDVDDYISKPFSREHIADTLRHLAV